MSSRRAWCQSRLNSSCSRASSAVRLNISLRRWTPRTVCTARLGRPLSTQYMGAKRSSSIRGSASFRKTSAQLLSRRLAFFGVTRNWTARGSLAGLVFGTSSPPLGPGAAPTTFYYIIPTLAQAGEGFLRTNQSCLAGQAHRVDRHVPINAPPCAGSHSIALRDSSRVGTALPGHS